MIRMFTSAQRGYLEILRRRRDFLKERATQKRIQQQKLSSYDEQERAALDWALNILDLVAAEAAGNPGYAQRKNAEALLKKTRTLQKGELMNGEV